MKGHGFVWIALLATLSLPLTGATASAALTWDADTWIEGPQDGDGFWMDSSYDNWHDGTANVVWSNANPTVAVFGVTGGTAGNVTVMGNATATGLTFNLGYSLLPQYEGSPDSITLVPDAGATPVITSLAGVTTTIGVPLGGGDINIDGASGGSYTLAVPNTWTGNLAVINPQFTSNIKLTVSASNALSPNGTVAVDNGAYITFSYSATEPELSFSTPLTLGGHGAGDAAPHSIRGVLILGGTATNFSSVYLSGDITLSADVAIGTGNFTPTTAIPQMTLAGNIGETAGGSKGITITGTGILELRGANTFTGNLIHYRSSSVVLNSTAGVALPGSFVFRNDTYGGKLTIAQNEQIGGGMEFAYTGTTSNRQIVELMDVTETLTGLTMTNNKDSVAVVRNGGVAAASLVLDTPVDTSYVYQGQVQDGTTGGTISVTKRGLGSQVLGGTSLVSGGTTVEAGTLGVNGAYTSAVDVQGGTLTGKGTITGNVTLDTDAFLAPGEGLGTMTVTGDVDLPGTLAVEYDVTAGATTPIDLLAVSGFLDLAGGTLSFSQVGEGTMAAGSYVFATYGTLTGNPATAVGLPSGWSVNYAYQGNQIALVVAQAPMLPGDTDGDGDVDDTDAAKLAANWLKTVAGGEGDGDFNGDNVVDDRDAAILAAHWVRGTGGTEGAVPEPSTFALLLAGLAALALLKRRGR